MKEDNSQKKHNIEELLKNGITVSFKPMGYSMYPMIVPDRDEVTIASIKGHQIRRGDVLVYRRPAGKLIIHRVYKATSDSVYMIGDNEHVVEGPIPKSVVYGYMTSFSHNNRHYSTRNIIYKAYYNIWLILINFREPIGNFIHKSKKGRK